MLNAIERELKRKHLVQAFWAGFVAASFTAALLRMFVKGF